MMKSFLPRSLLIYTFQAKLGKVAMVEVSLYFLVLASSSF